MSITQSQTEFGQFYATTGRSVTLVVLAHRMGDRVFDQKIERIMKKYYDRYYIFVVLSFVSIIIVLCIMIGLIGPPKR